MGFLREGRRGGSSQITLGFSRYIDKAYPAVIFAIAQLSCLLLLLLLYVLGLC